MGELFETMALIRRVSAEADPYASDEFGAFYHRVVAPSSHRCSGQRLVEILESSLATGARVLEVGTGTGITAADLATRRPDLDVVATDLSLEMMGAAGESRTLPNVTWQQADATALPFDDGSFDAVISANAIKHFPDKRLGVAEMLRVTRSGGQVLITEISPWASWRVASRLSEDMPLPGPMRTVIAQRAVRESGKLMGTRDQVAAWFTDHPGAASCSGLEDLHDARGRLVPLFMVTLHVA